MQGNKPSDLMTGFASNPLLLGGLMGLERSIRGEDAGTGIERGMFAAGDQQQKQAQQAARAREAAQEQQAQARAQQFAQMTGQPIDGITPEQMQVLQFMGPEQGAPLLMNLMQNRNDPMAAAELAYKQAQTAKLKREASAGPDGPSYGRSGGIFQAQNGQFYTVQFGDDGSRKILPVTADGQALTPSKGVTRVGDELVDQATGQTVRGVGGSIAGEEVAKIEGRTEGERRATFPKMKAAMQSLNNQWGVVGSTIDSVLPRINDRTAGLIGTAAAYVPGTEAYNLQRDLETIRANIGFDKLQSMRDNSPTGGALGQVSEFENRLLQAVNGSLAPGQSPEQLRRNLESVKDLLAKVNQQQNERFNQTYGDIISGGSSQSPAGRQVPPEAVQMLRSDPSRAQQFDEVFGQGAAQRVLSGG